LGTLGEGDVAETPGETAGAGLAEAGGAGAFLPRQAPQRNNKTSDIVNRTLFIIELLRAQIFFQLACGCYHWLITNVSSFSIFFN
jgi:hypothetical protein